MSADVIVLGLLTGLPYGLLAVGLVLVYRSSRFLNFAHGAIGVFGAAILGRLVNEHGIPYWVAFPLAIVAGAACAGAIEAGLLRRLRHRPRLIGMIVTLGLSQFLLVLALLVNPQGLSGLTFPKPPGLPSFTIGRTPVGPALTALLLLTPVLLAALALFLRHSRHGLAIRGAADAPETASLNGIAAARMATIAWAVAGGVAAFCAILVTPTQGTQSIETLGPELLLRGLAGAVVARLSSIPIAFAASLGIGVLEQILLAQPGGSGLVEVGLGLVILAALLAQPKLSSRRDDDTAGWPAVPVTSATLQGRVFTGLGLLAAASLAYLVTNETASVLTSIAGFALVGLSVLLVTGVAGELSLGQFAFAGIAAAVSVQVAGRTGNFFLGVLAGCAAAALAAILVGIPALRLRGLALAVTTLAFALATSAWLLRQDWLLGNGKPVPKPQWAGYPLLLAKDYYLFALLLLAIGLWLTHNLRRGGFGRTLRALRDNEDAARALSVAAPLRKLQAYAMAAVLAGLGGIVIGHGQSQLTVNSFPAGAGIDAVALAVVGGLGQLGGPLLGAILFAGVPGLIDLGIPGQAALTITWLLIVLLLPAGLASLPAKLLPHRHKPASLHRAPRYRFTRRRPSWLAAIGASQRQPSHDSAGPVPTAASMSSARMMSATPRPSPTGQVPTAASPSSAGLVSATPHPSPTGPAPTATTANSAGPAPTAASPRSAGLVSAASAGLAPALGAGGGRGWRLPEGGRVEPGRLAVRGVARAFGGVRAVNGVDLEVAPGEVVGLIGPNGAGKTTLFEIIAGFTRPQSGEVRFNGRLVTGLSPQRRARLGLVRSFQDARLFPAMSVRETVMVAGERLAPSSLLAAALGATGGPDRLTAARTEELLDLMGLQAQADTPVGALSTGTRRMVELTCLLAMRPTLMLLDEPSSGVSHADGLALAELLRHINKELGISLLVIEHDLPLLAGLADRMVAMEAGRVIATGTPEQVRAHPEVVRSYLGVAHA